MKGYIRKSKTRKALKSIVEIVIKSKNLKVTRKLWRAMKFAGYLTGVEKNDHNTIA